MATKFVGPGGSDANNGSTWALRKLTLAGVEAILAAGDVVQVGPGGYRVTLTTGVAGSNGSPITYIADVGGQNTDGVGGPVVISGSDNDTSATRTNCISCSHNFRTFRGFSFDGNSNTAVLLSNCTNAIIEDCFFNVTGGIQANGASQSTHTIRRCIFFGGLSGLAQAIFTHSATVDNTAHVIENCLFLAGGSTNNARTDRVGGITIRNCDFIGAAIAVRVGTALTGGQTVTVNNCIFTGCATALQATALGEIVEDRNDFNGNTTDRSTVNTGANSVSNIALLQGPLQTLGFPTWLIGALSSRSSLGSIAGTGVPAADIFNTSRANPSSWGQTQYIAGQRPFDAGQSRGQRQ